MPGPSPEQEREARSRAALEDDAVERARAAALREIRKWGDAVLRTKALPVGEPGEWLVEQVERMKVLMYDALGVGLAATQVGLLNRVLVYRTAPDVEPVVLVNPEIEWRSEESEEFSEGCLSLPGIYVTVVRPAQIRVRAQDERGEPMAIEAAGFEADVIQHEIDHLDGVLILDRTAPEQRREAIRALREGRGFDGTPPRVPPGETPR